MKSMPNEETTVKDGEEEVSEQQSIDPKRRSAIAKAEDITKVIKGRLEKGSDFDAKEGVDLGKIAQKLFKRKERETPKAK